VSTPLTVVKIYRGSTSIDFSVER